MKHNRRQFLSNSLQTLTAACLAEPVLRAAGPDLEWRNRQSGMAYRQLGRTRFMISEIVMGGNTIAPDNYEHVLMALDQGLNYLDTAPAYGRGRSEEGYAIVLRNRPRDQFFLTTKVSPWDLNRNEIYHQIFESLSESEQRRLRHKAKEQIAEHKADHPDYLCHYFNSQLAELESASLANVMEKKYGRRVDRGRQYKQIIIDTLEESLVRLGTDHVDLLMCPHGASTPEELENYPEIFEAFEVLKKAGKVRHLGVTAHSDPAGVVRAAAANPLYSAAMVAYNVVNAPFFGKTLERAAQKGLGVIAMKVARPVHPGRGRTAAPERVQLIEDQISGPWKTPQKAYLWALRNPRIAAVISEMMDAETVRDNLPLAGVRA